MPRISNRARNAKAADKSSHTAPETESPAASPMYEVATHLELAGSGQSTAAKRGEVKRSKAQPLTNEKPGSPASTAGKISGVVKPTKVDSVLKLLRSKTGATIPAMMQATDWQAHSVRGFLSGTVKKRLKLVLTSEVGKDGLRRYKVGSETAAG